MELSKAWSEHFHPYTQLNVSTLNVVYPPGQDYCYVEQGHPAARLCRSLPEPIKLGGSKLYYKLDIPTFHLLIHKAQHVVDLSIVHQHYRSKLARVLSLAEEMAGVLKELSGQVEQDIEQRMSAILEEPVSTGQPQPTAR